MLAVGDTAPDFTLPDQDGGEVTLSELRGQTVVLYFYPRADTPGCTTQACGIRDHAADYARAGARVIGVSPDPLAGGRRSSPTSTALELHAARRLRARGRRTPTGPGLRSRSAGKPTWASSAATFIVGPDGQIARVFPKVSPKTHDEVVLAALAELTGEPERAS